MEEVATLERIDDELWEDIQGIICDPIDNIASCASLPVSMSFGVGIASGFRFRYQSEIDNKTVSSFLGDNDKHPTLKIWSPVDVTLQLDLVTEDSTDNKTDFHFNTLYEVSKSDNLRPSFDNGVCFIQLKKEIQHEIKLNFLGIRKLKLVEAIPRIKELYPLMTDSNAKTFFHKHKNTVKVRALLFDNAKYVHALIFSNKIKSQISKEQKHIKIQHISPKIVADNGETLIVILEKKITSECKASIIFDEVNHAIFPIYQDGQSFVYRIPKYNLENPVTAKVKVQCDENFDEKPLRFLLVSSENRKRKSGLNENETPLKKTTKDENFQELFPESNSNVENRQTLHDSNVENDSHNQTIEYDCSEPMEATGPVSTALHNQIRENESCKDSGIHSNKSDDDSDDDSTDYSDSEEDLTDEETNRRHRNNNIDHSQPLNFPPTKRLIDSRLNPNVKDEVANKVFSEVARIAQDFAFGKKPSDLFYRIENQLPVVFTLQDDVGDTPLNNAILKGNVEEAEYILKVVSNQCKWALDLMNTSGHTALILAPACDIPATFISKLLNAGCRLDMRDDLGKSAITYAIEYKNCSALEVLLEHIKQHNMHSLLKRTNKVYYTPLQVAVLNNFAEGIAMLLSLKDKDGNYMVDVNELALMNKDTALHIAVERQCELEIIQLLLNRPDINVNHKKDNNATVLHTAMRMKLSEVVALLKLHNAEDADVVADPENLESDCDEEDENDDDAMEGDSSVAVHEAVHESSQAASGSVPAPREVVLPPSELERLIKEMEGMRLRGETFPSLVDVLLDRETGLSVSELVLVVKPTFRGLIEAAAAPIDVIDVIKRFNCLPNSLGQLFEALRRAGREDVIGRIVARLRR